MRRLKRLFKSSTETKAIDNADFVQPRQNAKLPFDRFADLLPYSAYDQDSQLFVIDGADKKKIEGWGFVVGISPQIAASEQMADFLTNLFSKNAPAGTGIQVQLFGSPQIEDFLNAMLISTVAPENVPEERKQQAAILKKMAEKRVDYYKKGALEEMFDNMNVRMRTYLSNISVIVPCDDLYDESIKRQVTSLRSEIVTTLKQYHLYESVWGAEDLINYLQLILNPQKTLQGDYPYIEYDPGKEIKYQIIDHATRMVENETYMKYDSGGSHKKTYITKSMSVKSYPKQIGLNAMRGLLGSESIDTIAYPCPFLITIGVSLPDYDKEKNRTQLKAARAQQSADSELGKFLPHLQDVNHDWKIMQHAFDAGQGNCKVYHQVLLFTEEENEKRAEQAAQSVFRAEQFELTVDRKMQKQGLIASMPMLFGPLLQKDLKIAQKISTKTITNAANMLPILAEWQGTPPRPGERFSKPVLNLFGRRGQALGIDIFANPSGNYNGIVVGTSGSGKSFFLNELTLRTLATGGRVWIIDVGRSYEKLCHLIGGQYIEFIPEAKLSLNPFSLVIDLDNDDSEMPMLLAVFEQMISPTDGLTDLERSLVKMHIMDVWRDAKMAGKLATIDDLANSLINNCEMGGPNPLAHDDDWKEKIRSMDYQERQNYCDPRIRDLGLQLHPFCETGDAGKYFEGRSNINFNSNFIVLELEELKNNKHLQSVVMMLLMYRITQEMYLGDRSIPKLVIIDEAWDLMTGNSGQFIEAGYRRARKYGGAFFTGTQSVDDYYKSPTSEAAFQNADWMFMLRQKPESIETLAKSGKLLLDESTKKMLNSVKTVQGMFSEVFIRGGDMPAVIGRLFADPFTLLSSSSRAEDFEAVRKYTRVGMPTEQAINAVIKERGGVISEEEYAEITAFLNNLNIKNSNEENHEH